MRITHRSIRFSCAAASLSLLGWSATAPAVPQFVQSLETPNCDPLMNLTLVDELGLAPIFPPDERIDAFATQTTISACPPMDNPNIPNALVRMTNLTTQTFFDVHYVADPPAAGLGGTNITNDDGLVNAGQAFRIDNVGVNRPLVAESIFPNLLFQPGESWTFVVQDYQNAFNLPASAFLSIGVGAASPGPPSSGSIIALFPEPSSLGLAAIGVPVLLRRQRRRRCA